MRTTLPWGGGGEKRKGREDLEPPRASQGLETAKISPRGGDEDSGVGRFFKLQTRENRLHQIEKETC